MTLRGFVEHGRIVLEGGVVLPDGTPVEVVLRRAEPGRQKPKAKAARVDAAYTLSRHAVRTGVPDLAAEHDHYASGGPKRVARSRRRKSA